MPYDFLEELNNEKKNLTSGENTSEVNEQLAENLQKVIDKAQESSESYEILERVVNSFNASGKNLSDNLGLIIDTFNKLNGAIKNNSETASSLKQTYNSNIFGGAVKGAENLIKKLDEIQQSINSFGGERIRDVFVDITSGGKKLLDILQSAKKRIEEINALNVSENRRVEPNKPVQRDKNTGDVIVTHVNEIAKNHSSNIGGVANTPKKQKNNTTQQSAGDNSFVERRRQKKEKEIIASGKNKITESQFNSLFSGKAMKSFLDERISELATEKEKPKVEQINKEYSDSKKEIYKKYQESINLVNSELSSLQKQKTSVEDHGEKLLSLDTKDFDKERLEEYNKEVESLNNNLLEINKNIDNLNRKKIEIEEKKSKDMSGSIWKRQEKLSSAKNQSKQEAEYEVKNEYEEIKKLTAEDRSDVKGNVEAAIAKHMSSGIGQNLDGSLRSQTVAKVLFESLKNKQQENVEIGKKEVENLKKLLEIRGESKSRTGIQLDFITKAGLEQKVGKIKKTKGEVTEQDIKRIVQKYLNTVEGATFVKDNGFDEEVLTGTKRKKRESVAKIEAEHLLNQTAELTQKFANLAKQLNEFGLGFSRLAVDLARQSASGSDVLAGQTVSSWGGKFDLTMKQSSQLFPVIESFVRNSNVSLDTVNGIAENLKNATGALNPEDLKTALSALQGMTQGQVNAMTGRGSSMSDRYGAAFTLMENSAMLDAAIKASSMGAFSGETPNGLSEGDKALLDNNQKMLKAMEGIQAILASWVNRYIPFVSAAGTGASKLAYGALGTMHTVNSAVELGRNVTYLRNILKASSSTNSVLAKISTGVAGIGGTVAVAAGAIAAIGLAVYGINKYLQSKIDEKYDKKQRVADSKLYSNINEDIETDHSRGIESDHATQQAIVTGISATVGTAAGIIAGIFTGGLPGVAVGVGTAIATQSLLTPIFLKKALDKRADEDKYRTPKPDGYTAKQYENAFDNQLTSLRSLKTYQTLNQQLKSGQFTKFEDAMSRFAENNIKAISSFGGSNAGFQSFSNSKAVYATASFTKSIAVINNGLNNLSKGLNANGREAINGEFALAAYNTLIERQIDVTKKWINEIESSIGRYSEIPSVILNEVLNKISSFYLGSAQIGGGSMAGNRQQILEMSKRSQQDYDNTINQFGNDIAKGAEGVRAYKKLQIERLNQTNESLKSLGGKQYTMDELKNPEVQQNIQKKVAEKENTIKEELAKKGLDMTDFSALSNYQQIANLKYSNYDQKADQNNALKLLDNMVDDIKNGNVKVDGGTRETVLSLQKAAKASGITKEDWRSIQNISKSVYASKQTEYNNKTVGDTEFRKKIDSNMKELNLLRGLTTINDGSKIEADFASTMYKGFDEISKNYNNVTQMMIKSAVSNPITSFQNIFSNIEGKRAESNRWQGVGIGKNVSNTLAGAIEGTSAAVVELENAKNIVMKDQSTELKEQARMLAKKARVDEGKVTEYASAVDKRKKLRDMLYSGETKTKDGKDIKSELSNTEKQIESLSKTLGKSTEAKLVRDGIDRFSADQSKRVAEFTAKIEETKASIYPAMLKQIELLTNIETFSSKTYQAIADANSKAVVYLGGTGAGSGRVWESARANLEASSLKGREEVRQATESYEQIKEKGPAQWMNERLAAIKQQKGKITNQDRQDVLNAYRMAVSKSGGTAIDAQTKAYRNNENVLVGAEQAANTMSLQRQESLNLEKALLTTVGAPLQELLRIEKESLKESYVQYQNASKRYQQTLKAAKEGRVDAKAIGAARINLQKQSNKYLSQMIGAQRSVMEQMFGRLVGTFKGQAGFAGASTFSKYGAGASVNAQGQVLSLGAENLGAHNSYGERILGQQLSALGITESTSGKNEKIESIVEDMKKLIHADLENIVKVLNGETKPGNQPEKDKNTNLNADTFNKGVDRIVSAIQGKNQPENKPSQKPENKPQSKEKSVSQKKYDDSIREDIAILENDLKNPQNKDLSSFLQSEITTRKNLLKAREYDSNITLEVFQKLKDKKLQDKTANQFYHATIKGSGQGAANNVLEEFVLQDLKKNPIVDIKSKIAELTQQWKSAKGSERENIADKIFAERNYLEATKLTRGTLSREEFDKKVQERLKQKGIKPQTVTEYQYGPMGAQIPITKKVMDANEVRKAQTEVVNSLRNPEPPIMPSTVDASKERIENSLKTFTSSLEKSSSILTTISNNIIGTKFEIILTPEAKKFMELAQRGCFAQNGKLLPQINAESQGRSNGIN